MIRSWRDRGFWLPIACAALLVFVLTWSGDLWTRRYLQGLQELRTSDPASATAAADLGLRVLAWTVCGFALGCAALLARYFQLGLREQRLPPAGWWSLGARKAAVGPGTRALCRFGLGLALVIATAGIGCLVAMGNLLEALRG